MQLKPTIKRKQTQKPSILWIATLLAVLFALILTAFSTGHSTDQTTDNDERDLGLAFRLHGPSLFDERVVSVSEAERILAQNTSAPGWLPNGFTFQGIFVERSIRSAELVFGSSPLPSGTLMLREILTSGYWVLIISPWEFGDPGPSIDQAVQQSDGRVQPVMIGKYAGQITCPGDFNNEVVWWMNHHMYDLVTPLGTTSNELVGFCESVTDSP